MKLHIDYYIFILTGYLFCIVSCTSEKPCDQDLHVEEISSLAPYTGSYIRINCFDNTYNSLKKVNEIRKNIVTKQKGPLSFGTTSRHDFFMEDGDMNEIFRDIFYVTYGSVSDTNKLSVNHITFIYGFKEYLTISPIITRNKKTTTVLYQESFWEINRNNLQRYINSVFKFIEHIDNRNHTFILRNTKTNEVVKVIFKDDPLFFEFELE